MPVERQAFSPLPKRPGGEPVPDEAIQLLTGPDRGYQRTGGCHSGCGLCCEYVILPLDRRVLQSSRYGDWKRWLELHGVELAVSPERLEARIPVTCKHLQEDKSCAVFGQPERPELCGAWPARPFDLLETGMEDACSYDWKPINIEESE